MIKSETVFTIPLHYNGPEIIMVSKPNNKLIFKSITQKNENFEKIYIVEKKGKHQVQIDERINESIFYSSS